jgi:ketosteroid isomerase-like protein
MDAAYPACGFIAGERAQSNAELREQVRQTERAFAKTLADRDVTAFTTFLATDTVFMSGGKALRGANC